MTHTNNDDNLNVNEEPTVDAAEPTTESQASLQELTKAPSHEAQKPPKNTKNVFKRFGAYFKTHKKLTIPLTVLALVAVILLVPYTRYMTIGSAIKQNIDILVIDSTTGKPVAGALVNLQGVTATTNADGHAPLKVKLGHAHATITKKYYKDSIDLVVTADVIGKNKHTSYQVKLIAVGRQVPVEVNNKISGVPLEGVHIKADGTEAVTDKEGKSVIVLPADQTEADATFSKDGYNDQSAKITITDKTDPKNSFTVTPAGKVYFLSKQSGKIDVVKTNLDGSARQTVLPGTGTEDDRGTVMLASRDWKYLALYARRDGTSKSAKLYLIETGSDKVSNMDEGDAVFTLQGWAEHRFVYRVDRNNIQAWQPKRVAFKYYDAEKKALSTIEEIGGSGDQNDTINGNFGWSVLTGNNLVYYRLYTENSNYVKYGFNGLSDKSNALIDYDVSSGKSKTVKEFPLGHDDTTTGYYYALFGSYQAVLYEPSSILFYVDSEDKGGGYFQYEDGQLKTNSQEAKDYFANYKPYPTYLASPDGSKTLWSDSRDGKNVLFVGDKDGKNEQQIASLTEYEVYGWFTNDYILVTKKGSELYILPKNGLKNGVDPLKISDYHKPAQSFIGYGGGYGGI